MLHKSAPGWIYGIFPPSPPPPPARGRVFLQHLWTKARILIAERNEYSFYSLTRGADYVY